MDFLLMRGRINRIRFLVVSLLPVALVFTLCAVAVASTALHVRAGILSPGLLDIAVLSLAGLFLSWVMLAACVTRLHDMGQTGLWVLIAFIPGVALLLWLFLLFAAGEPDLNRFGSPPR